MRVVSKFAVAFFVAASLCLALYTYALASRAAARLERTVTAGLTDTAIGLRGALESAWRDRGLDAAKEAVHGFDRHSEIGVRFELNAAQSNDPSAATTTDDVVVTSREPSPSRAGEGSPRTLMVTVPVRDPQGNRSGLLILERDVPTGAALLRAELGTEIAAGLALALVIAIIAVVLGSIVIGRPLGRIVAQTRRIGRGDLSQRLKSTGTDEIGMLKREINTMTDRLEDAYARLEEEAAANAETLEQLRHLDRLRTVGTIASSIAHELGTPLSILLLRGQSLASAELESSEDVVASGKAIVSQVEKMSAIVRQLLDFTRSRNRVKKESEFRIIDLAKHSCELLEGVARKHKVRLEIVDTPKTGAKNADLRVKGQFEQLEQAVTNLIVNAIHSMHDHPNGSIKVAVGTSKMEAKKARGDEVATTTMMATIEITDEGTGIDDKLLGEIFEPFFTTKASGEGTGLGLHVARGIAEEHGGKITVRSRVNKGSTFILHLPLVSGTES